MFYAEQPSLSTLRTVVRQPVATELAPVKELSTSKSVTSVEDVVEFSNWAALPKWKRALDISLILLAAPFLAPVMIFMALLIKIVSPGPVFYTQERVGRMGKSFRLFKFRTMRADSAATPHQDYLKGLLNSNQPMAKLDHKDTRVIPFGRVIRASGLDELAQLINVLRGEMSLVGPRPCTPYEYEHYQAWQKERFNALPGLTGLWQVSGKNTTTFVQMINLDIEYSRNQSFFKDLWILISTPAVVCGQLLQLSRSRVGTKPSQEESAKPRAAVS